MKSYSAKTNVLAAEAVLTAAVDEAVGLLRSPGRLIQSSFRTYAAAAAALTNTTHLRYEWVKYDLAQIEATLLAAAQSAELLLDRATLLDEGRAS